MRKPEDELNFDDAVIRNLIERAQELGVMLVSG